jgi:NADH-quinone oxidoreductase subunit F
MVFDETTSVVRVVSRWLEFYKHESCGKCTPCREGTYWLVDLLRRFDEGRAAAGDLEKTLELGQHIMGRSFCPLGDAAATPYPAALKYFRQEFEAGTRTPVHEDFPPAASTVFSGATV